MHVLEDLSYVLEDMIEPIAKKQDISPTELDNVYKAVKTMNYIETIKAMKEYGNSNGGSSYGNSYRGGNSMDRGYYDNMRSMDVDGRYSERRGRDAKGRYTSRDGESKEQMISKLERMMSDASSESERQTIMDCIRKLENER